VLLVSKDVPGAFQGGLGELHPDLFVGVDTTLPVKAKEVDFLAVAQAFEGVAILRGARKSPVLRGKALSEGGDLVKLAGFIMATPWRKIELLAEADFEVLVPFGDDDVHGITLSRLEVAVKGFCSLKAEFHGSSRLLSLVCSAPRCGSTMVVSVASASMSPM